MLTEKKTIITKTSTTLYRGESPVRNINIRHEEYLVKNLRKTGLKKCNV